MADTKKTTVNKKRMAVFVLAAVVVLLLLLRGIPTLVSLVFGHSISNDCVTVAPDAISSYDFDIYRGQLVLFNSQGLKAYNYKGEYQWDVPMKVASPRMDVSGDYAIVMDVGGSELQNLHKGKVKFTLKTAEPIQTASVNENGYTTVITSEKGYKSLVSIYNDQGQELYKWYSGEIYVTDAKTSADGKKMAAVGLDANKNNVSSMALFFDLNADNPTAQVILEDMLAYQLTYAGHDVQIISDKKIQTFKSNGQVKSTYDFEGRALQAFDAKDPANVVVALSETTSEGAGSEILVLNQSLKKKGHKSLPVEVTMLDYLSDRIVAGGQRQLYVLSGSGRQLASGHMVKDAKYVKMTGDGKHIVTMSGSLINIYSLRLGR